MIALDVTGFLQRTHAPQTRGRRDLCPARQLDIGDPAVALQLGEDSQVDGVEFVTLHEKSLR